MDNNLSGHLPEPFLGSSATASGEITRRRLRGGGFRRIFRDVYVLASEPDSHELRCRAAALIAPAGAVITGRSAATLHGVALAHPEDPVQLVIPERARFHHRAGLDVQRRPLRAGEAEPWQQVAIATPLRLGLDLLLGRGLMRGVADLDMAVRAGLVDLDELRASVRRRQRLNRLRAAGWRVVFVTAERMHADRSDIAWEVRAALTQRLASVSTF